MASSELAGTVTQSMAKEDKSIDPYFHLIMNDDLAENKWPKVVDEYKKQPKHSLMAQTMSKALFDKLKDVKSSSGWTIANAINTGVCYPDSFVGCHAGDLDSYKVFKDLFYPVIEKYHVGYKLDGSMKHVTSMDPDHITVDLTDAAKSIIVSTRIRCARNLAMFPLNTSGSLKTRMEISDTMEAIFKEMSSSAEYKDLGGTFFRHTTMTKEEEQKLIDDHFLFKGKDKMQAASGYHRFWPHGRGIFCSNDKKFLLWINEGDHLRIISMEQSGDIKGVLRRLHRGAVAIEHYLKKKYDGKDVFMSDPILGMITCCPSNLGTGLRASVHCRVPNLIKKLGFQKIDELARSMKCQARGTMGEHSEVTDTVDVSNWRRLGFPENELVQDMIKCINMFAEMECAELAGTLTQSMAKKDTSIDPYFQLIMNDDLAENNWPKVVDEYKKQPKHSLMAQTMSKALFDKLKNVQSSSGWTIANAINTGVCYPDSFVGCHAGDLDSYKVFKDLFYPVIEKYHVGYKLDGSMKHVTSMDPDHIKVDLTNEAKSIIVSTRIRCARNLAMFPLNTSGSLQTRMEISDAMEAIFKEMSSSAEYKDLGGTFFRHTTMTKEEEQKLIDDHFLFKGKDKMQAASGYHRFWPHGRGIFCSNDKKFLLWINEGDHLRIISMEQSGDIKGVLRRLHRGAVAIEHYLKKKYDGKEVFMSDPILGMITCCPSNLGTGLRASVHCRVPKLIKKIGFEKIDELARSMKCQARGTMGEHSEVTDTVDVSNWRRLGFPENELVQDMIKCINKLAEMECSMKD